MRIYSNQPTDKLFPLCTTKFKVIIFVPDVIENGPFFLPLQEKKEFSFERRLENEGKVNRRETKNSGFCAHVMQFKSSRAQPGRH